MLPSFTLQTIAIAHTPFTQKFAIPRQAGLVDLPSKIELLAPYNHLEAVNGLEQISHLWLSFIFHQHADKAAALQVRPPRLGGNKKIGVFATRSSFRPNCLGQSLVKLLSIEQSQQGLFLHVNGLDVLNGTPIVDIKPYLPYADCLPDAVNAIAPQAPTPRLMVQWQAPALAQLVSAFSDDTFLWQQRIEQLIALDPRPAYKQQQAQGNYVMRLYQWDIHWQMCSAENAEITQIVSAN